MKKTSIILVFALISFTSISQATPTHPLLDNKKTKTSSIPLRFPYFFTHDTEFDEEL